MSASVRAREERPVVTGYDGLAEGRFAEHRLVVADDPVRAAEQAAKRRERILEIEELGEKLVAKLDAQDKGASEKGRKASDRGAYSRFQRAIAEAELTRFIHADYAADRFSYAIDEDAIAAAERFDGKLVLLTNVPDFSAAKVVERYKSLADIERGFRVLKSDLLIAPVHHRLPERIRAHALICFFALTMYRVMRMRLKAAGHAASPAKALEQLRRIQQHRATIGDQAYTGLSRTTQEQLSLFEALKLPKPPKTTCSVIFRCQRIDRSMTCGIGCGTWAVTLRTSASTAPFSRRHRAK